MREQLVAGEDLAGPTKEALEFAFQKGYNEFGMITGKPIALGGSQGRGDATARGGMYTVREAASHLGIDLANATVAVQRATSPTRTRTASFVLGTG